MGFDREKRLGADPRDHGLDDGLGKHLLGELRPLGRGLPGKRTLVAEDRASPVEDRGGDVQALAASLPWDDTQLDGMRARGLSEVLETLGRGRGKRGLMDATVSAAHRATHPAAESSGGPPDPHGSAMWSVAERRGAALYRDAVDSGEIDAEDPAVTEALARIGGGNALPEPVRKAMELELGISLGRVRVHTDSVAADAATAVRARAFTVGEDIFFADGAYAPETPAGRRLLAHELAHVLQAYQGRLQSSAGGGRVTVSSPGESLEHEAEGVAARLDRADRPAAAPAGDGAQPRHQPVESAPAIASTSTAARMMRKADPVSAKPSPNGPKQPAVQPKLRFSRDHASESAQHRANRARGAVKSTSRELSAAVGNASKTSLGHLEHGVKQAKAQAVGQQAKRHNRQHLDQAKAGEQSFEHHAKQALAKTHDKPIKHEHVHAHDTGGQHHGGGVQFKEIGDYGKYMPEPLPDSDAREKARILALVKKKLERDRAEARRAIETLRQAQHKQAAAVRAMAPALKSQIAGAQSSALGAVSAAESSRCAAVQARVAQVQATVTASATTAKASVTHAHTATVTAIKAATRDATQKLTAAKTKATADIAAAEVAQHQVITQQFQRTKEQIVQLGAAKAGEARGLGDSASLPFDGDKLEAAQKAAREVAAAYADAMPGEASKAADQIGSAEPQAQTDTTKIATDQTKVIEDAFAKAKQALQQVEQQAIKAADTAKEQALQQVEQCASSTSSALKAHGASQLSSIRQQGAQARAGIIKQGQAAQAGVSNACTQAAAGLEKGAEGIIKGALQVEAPDPAHTHAAVREGIAQLQSGARQVTAGLKSQTGTSCTSLSSAASGATQGIAATAQAASEAATQIGDGGTQQLQQIAKGATESLKQIGQNQKKTADQVAKDGQKGFEEVAKATHKAYSTSTQQLTTALGDQVGQVRSSFNEAVPTKELADIQANAQKAADAVKPWWQRALAFVVSIVVAIVVVVVITALIVTTGPVGAILVGAAAGALGSVMGQMASNLVLGNGLTEGITWQSVAMGAIGGGVAAGLTAGVGALAGNLAAGTGRAAVGATAVKTALAGGQGLTSLAIRTGVGVGSDFVSDAAAQLIVTGKYEFSTQNLITSLATNAVTSTKKFSQFQESAGGKVRSSLGLPPVDVHVDAPSGHADGGGGGSHAGGGGPPSGPAPHATGGDHGGPTPHSAGGDHAGPSPHPTGGDHAPHPAGGDHAAPAPRPTGGDHAGPAPRPTGGDHAGPAPHPAGGDHGPGPHPTGEPPAGRGGTVEHEPAPHRDDGPAERPPAGHDPKDTRPGHDDPARTEHDPSPKHDQPEAGKPRTDHGAHDDPAAPGSHPPGAEHDGAPSKTEHAPAKGEHGDGQGHGGDHDDAGYPQGTHEKGDQAATDIEQGGKPRKNDVRDTEANQRGIKDLEALLADPTLTPQERVKIQKELAEKLRAQDDPTGNLERDLDEVKTKHQDGPGKDPNAKDPDAKDPDAKDPRSGPVEESSGPPPPLTPEQALAFRDVLGSNYDQLMAEARALRADPDTAKLLANHSDEEIAAMIGYTSNDYYMLNKALRSGDPAELTRLAPYIGHATRGLDGLPNFQGTVFRGTTLAPDKIARYQVGEVVTEPAFTSTSYDPSSQFPGNVDFIIQSRTGKQIDFLSQFKSEKEVLFKPGSRFKVLDVQDVNGKTVITMTEAA